MGVTKAKPAAKNTASNKEKTTATANVANATVNDKELELAKENAELKNKLAENDSKFNELQKQIELLMQNQQHTPVVTIQQDNQAGRSVKVTSLINGGYALSTLPRGQGRSYVFENFGDTKKIKYSDMVDIVNLYREQFSLGYVLLHDAKDYEDLDIDLHDEALFISQGYKSILELKHENDVEIILGFDEGLRSSFLSMIARKYVRQECSYDNRLFDRLKRETNDFKESLQGYIEIEQEDLDNE